MEKSGKSNTMTVMDCRILGAQKGMALPLGKTHKGRVVQGKATAIRMPNQRAVASSTFRQTTENHAVTNAPGTTWKTANTVESRAQETKSSAYKLTNGLKMNVDISLDLLEKEKKKHGENSLLFCLAVSREFNQLMNKFKINKGASEDYKFLESKLGSQYKYSLHQALETLKSKADGKCSWEHHKDLISLMKHLDLQQDKSPEEIANKELTRQLCEQFLHNEICYLEHIKNFPVADVAKESAEIVECLVNFLLNNPHYNPIKKEELNKFRSEKNRLLNIIESNNNNGSASEYIEKMEKNLANGPTDMQDKRLYNDLLRVKLEEIRKKNKGKGVSITERFSILKELAILRRKCIHFTGEFHSVLREITATVSGITKQILKQCVVDFIQLEDEVMDFIGDLMTNDILGNECGRLYLRCNELQNAMRTIVRTGEITVDQFVEQLDKIDLLIGDGTEDSAMKAGDMLKDLLYGHWYKIKELDTDSLQLLPRIKEINNMLFKILFEPIINTCGEYGTEMGGLEEYDIRISKYRPVFVRLSPYLFIIDSKERNTKWNKLVCAAWNCDLKRLLQEESLKETDIDCLLDLKRSGPDVHNPYTRVLLEEIFERLFQDILKDKDYGKKIPQEKFLMLHQWIFKLITLQGVSKQRQEKTNAELKELNKAWEIRNKDTRVSVTSDQPVLIRHESEESSSSGNKSLSTQTTKTSATTVPKTSIFFPELPTDFERDKSSLATDFSGAAKQLTSATASMVMTQLSQATPLSSLDVDQPLFMTDKPIPQSTVIAPIEMMASGGNMDMKTENRSVQETQKGMPPPQKKTKTPIEGGVQKARTIQTTSQMTATSNTFRKTTSTDYAVTVLNQNTHKTTWRAVDVEESREFKIVECGHQPTGKFRLEVEKSLKTLEKQEKKYGAATLSFCRAVVIEFDRLKNKFKMNTDTESNDYKFMECQLAPYYVNSLRPALDTLKSEADEQCAWEHCQDFLSLMKYFYLQTDETSIRNNRKLLKYIYKQLLQNEIDYQNYVSNVPLIGITSYSSTITTRLLNEKKCQLRNSSFWLISEWLRNNITTEIERLNKVISSQTKNGSIDEHIEKLEKKMCTKDAGILDKRLYADLLRAQVKKLTKINDKSSHGRFLELKKVCALHDKCLTFLNGSERIKNDVKLLISCIVKQILEESMNHVVPLEQEVLDFIGQLMTNDMLGNECKWLYLACKESPARMKTAAPVGKITDAQCENKISEIRLLLEKKARTELLAAAEMLGKLLHDYYDEITRLPKADLHLSAIKRIKNTLCKELFQPVLDKFDKSRAIGHNKEYNEEYNNEMDGYRSVFVELNPYTFVVNNQKRTDWLRAACAAWYCPLERMFQDESFRADDVDCLLALKRIAPGMPNPHIRILLGKVLEKLLSAMLGERTCDIPDEKLATISQWIEDLVHIKGINKQQKEHDDAKLKELNEAWKIKNKGTTISVTSDRPVIGCSFAPT